MQLVTVIDQLWEVQRIIQVDMCENCPYCLTWGGREEGLHPLAYTDKNPVLNMASEVCKAYRVEVHLYPTGSGTNVWGALHPWNHWDDLWIEWQKSSIWRFPKGFKLIGGIQVFSQVINSSFRSMHKFFLWSWKCRRMQTSFATEQQALREEGKKFTSSAWRPKF